MKDNRTMRQLTTFSLAGATAALALSPVQAAQLPPVAQPAAQIAPVAVAGSDFGVDEAQQYRRYRYHRRHRGGGVDAGDVIAGALILGGIFAIASAATSSDRDDRDYVRNDAFDRAVDRCISRVERQSRVGSDDNVGRTGSGYSVTGTTYDGSGFTCRVNRSGQVLDVRYGRGYQGYDGYQSDQGYGDSQYSDEAYARARGNTYSTQSYGYPRQGSTAQPAYPGGPVPGEDYDDYDGDPDDGYGEPY